MSGNSTLTAIIVALIAAMPPTLVFLWGMRNAAGTLEQIKVSVDGNLTAVLRELAQTREHLARADPTNLIKREQADLAQVKVEESLHKNGK